MTSTTSCKNKFIAMLKKVFMRNVGSFAFFQLLSIGGTLFLVKNLYPEQLLEDAKKPIDITDDVTFYFACSLLVASVIVSFFVVLNSYREVLTRRGSDFCFSLPVKRETYYNSNYIFSLINIVLFYALSIALVLLFFKTNSFFEIDKIIFDEKMFVKVMIISLAVSIFSLSIFSFSAVLSGRIIHYILFCFVVIIVFMVGASSVIGYLNNMIQGLHIDMSIADMLSPAGSFILLAYIIRNDDLKILVFSLVLAVLYYLLGLISFKKRQVEVSEFSPSGKIIPAILLVLTQFSLFMFNLSLDYASALVRGILGILFIVVLSVGCAALFYRKVFTKTTLINIAVSIILSVSFVLCVKFIPNISYVKYVPKADEIETVSIYNNTHSTSGAFDELLNLIWGETTDNPQNNNAIVIQGENASSVIELHKKMISNKADKTKIGDIYKIELEYKLKNGKTVKRFYAVNGISIKNEYAEVIRTDDALHQIGVFNDKKELLFVSYEKYDDNNDTKEYDDYLAYIDEMPYISNNFDLLRNSMINDIKTLPANIIAYKFEKFPESNKEDYQVGSLYFYFISNTATKAEQEKIQSMTFTEVIECYNRDNMIENPLYGKIDCYRYPVFIEDRDTQRFIDMYLQNN